MYGCVYSLWALLLDLFYGSPMFSFFSDLYLECSPLGQTHYSAHIPRESSLVQDCKLSNKHINHKQHYLLPQLWRTGKPGMPQYMGSQSRTQLKQLSSSMDKHHLYVLGLPHLYSLPPEQVSRLRSSLTFQAPIWHLNIGISRSFQI